MTRPSLTPSNPASGTNEAISELLKILPTSDSPLPDRQQLKDWVPEVARAADEVREALATERAIGAALDGARLYRAWWAADWAAGNYPTQWEGLSTPTKAVWNDAAARLASETPRPGDRTPEQCDHRGIGLPGCSTCDPLSDRAGELTP